MSEHPLSPVELVLAEVRRRAPSAVIEQLQVAHAADDDDLWFIRDSTRVEVQIGSHPGGQPPFLVEGDMAEQREETSEVHRAVELILEWLATE